MRQRARYRATNAQRLDLNGERQSFSFSRSSVSPELGLGPDAEHPKRAHLRRSRTSQPMRKPHPGGGTEKLPMTEPAPREMRLMRASCRRGTAACPIRSCDQRGWKAEQPVGRWGGEPSANPPVPEPRRAAPIAARHGPRCPAPRRAGRAPRCRRYRRCPAQ